MSRLGPCRARISGDRQTDRHTHTQTHKPSTVTLAVHACWGLIMTLVCDMQFDTCLWYAICITCSVLLFLSVQEFRFLRTLSLSSASSPKRISPPRTDGMCAVGGLLYALCSVYNPAGVQIFYSVLLILAEPWPSMCMHDISLTFQSQDSQLMTTRSRNMKRRRRERTSWTRQLWVNSKSASLMCCQQHSEALKYSRDISIHSTM